MTDYVILAPEILLLLSVAWALFAEHLPGGDRGSVWVAFALSLAGAVAAALTPLGGELFGGVFVIDGVARFARTGVAAISALWFLWTAGRGEGRLREAVALAGLSAIGGLVMSGARELITLVLAVELSTMPAYVLIGYRRHRIQGLEGALKYFLLSMLTSLVMLYGMSFLFGVSGSTYFVELDVSAAGTLGLLAVVLTYVGLFAKLSAAPFHYWAPDAYEGAEAWTVAFVSTVPKLAGAVAVVRLTAALAPSAPSIGTAFVAVAAASMLLGNFAALQQHDLRRLMAYSGVAHTGYLLLGAGALSRAGLGAAVFYALAYALPSLGIMLVVAEEGSHVSDLGGLSARRPVAAWSVVIMVLSLIGIPPLVGFFGKLYLFFAALEAGLTAWVVLAVVVSVVSAGYYLRIVRSMFFGERSESAPLAPRSHAADAAVAMTALLVLALGLAAGPLLGVLGAPVP
jgi:NADH-quinone oxidoreductase subunit N